MIQGTTPTHTFNGIDQNADEIWVDYSQIKDVYGKNNNSIIQKVWPSTDGSTTFNANTGILTVKLNEEDTFKFNPSIPIIYIQIRCRVGNVVMSSNIITTTLIGGLNSKTMVVN